jgi:hypothetical protein
MNYLLIYLKFIDQIIVYHDKCRDPLRHTRGDYSLLYFAYTCFGDLFIGGVIYLAKKIIRWWCVHVKNLKYYMWWYFTCKFFYKIYLQWIYWTLFFIAHCSTIFAQWSPRGDIVLKSLVPKIVPQPWMPPISKPSLFTKGRWQILRRMFL